MKDVLIVNGKEFVGSKGHLYEVIDGKKIRVSKEYFDTQCKDEVMKTRVNKDKQIKDEGLSKMETINKGVKMTYADKVEKFGIDTKWLKDKFGNYAYKAEWTDINNREMSGEYLVIHNGEPMMIRELTFKGVMHVQKLNNFRIVGMFNGWNKLITNKTHIDSFESRGKVSTKLDEIDFDTQFDMALATEKDIIDVIKFNLGNHELVGYQNGYGHLFGVKLYSVYKAEKEIRMKPKTLDDMFDSALENEIKQNELYKVKSFDEVTYTPNTIGDEPWN